MNTLYLYRYDLELVHVHRIKMVYMCIAVAAVQCYNIYIVLQIDQGRYFIIVFNNILML